MGHETESVSGPPAESFTLRVQPTPACPRGDGARFLAMTTVLGALAGLGLAWMLRVRAWPLAIAGGLGVLIAAALQLRSERRLRVSLAGLAPRMELSNEGLTLVCGGLRTPVLAGDVRHGLSLLSSAGRETLILAITHRDGVEYLGGRNPTGTRHVELLGESISVPESDLPLLDETRTFDEADVLLDLCAALAARSPGALERVYLSDAGMADVVVDDRRLRAGQLDFDLRAPLRFRAFAFQEGSMLGAHGFQATHVRQGEREVVLVALASASEIGSSAVLARHDGPMALDTVRRALGRDLRLAQGLIDIPPPAKHRVAIDRLFMPRLRVALDGAPIAIEARTSSPPEPRLPTPEGMDRLRASSPDVRG